MNELAIFHLSVGISVMRNASAYDMQLELAIIRIILINFFLTLFYSLLLFLLCDVRASCSFHVGNLSLRHFAHLDLLRIAQCVIVLFLFLLFVFSSCKVRSNKLSGICDLKGFISRAVC